MSATADSKAQLLVRHDNLNALNIFIQHHFRHFGRGQRVNDKRGRILRPRNDVDLFALQFIDNRLHAAAAHAHASPDRINARVAGNHGNFCAAARVARDGANFDDAIINFRHFLAEQFRHESRV